MTRCLLDTDILSEIIKGKDATVAARATAYLASYGRLTTSAISVAEIVYGLRRVGREDLPCHLPLLFSLRFNPNALTYALALGNSDGLSM